MSLRTNFEIARRAISLINNEAAMGHAEAKPTA